MGENAGVDLELRGKVAWVSGGSGGIGAVAAAVLAEEGCEVAITARDEHRLAEVAGALTERIGRNVLALQADTSDTSAVEDAAARIDSHFGRLDILVNCAGAAGGL